MADQQAFFDLLDIMENEKLVEPTRFFDLMRGTFSIANLLYIDVDVLTAGFAIHRLHHTFSVPCLRTYVDGRYQRIYRDGFKRNSIRQARRGIRVK